MQEDLLQYLWSVKCLGKDIHTDDGRGITILKTGLWNNMDGPDFLNALLQIGDQIWAGHVEIHVEAKAWYEHGHQDDPKYNPVVLHVVWKHSDKRPDIPTLILSEYISPSLISKYEKLLQSEGLACQGYSLSISSLQWQSFLDGLLADRMQSKREKYCDILESNNYDWSDLLYKQLARAMGQKANGPAMEELARRLPLSILAKHKNNLTQLESLLLGTSGLLGIEASDDYHKRLIEEAEHLMHKYGLSPMIKEVWRMGGLRPANFPTLRLAQLAQLIHQSSQLMDKLLECGSAAEMMSLLDITAVGYWEEHYRPGVESKVKKEKRLGNSLKNNIIINAVLPILWLYGGEKQNPEIQERALEWMGAIKAEDNKKLRLLEALQIPNRNAADSQSLLELYDSYCTEKKCLQCPRGQVLISG